MRPRPWLLFAATCVATDLLAACSGATAPADDPARLASAAVPSEDPAHIATPTVGSTDGAATAASTPLVASSSTLADLDGPDGVRRLGGWDGPKTAAAVRTKRAWVVAPNLMGEKLSFASVFIRLVTVDKANDEEVIFTEGGHRYGVPAALAWPAEPARGLKKGDVVRCDFGGNSAVARVDAVDAREVTCAFRFMRKTEKARMSLDSVFKLDGNLAPGAPVFVKFDEDDARYEGMVLATVGDDVWVLVQTRFSEPDPKAHRPFHKVKAANVTALDLEPLKVGDACAADHIARIEACEVTKVIDGGLGYVVTFGGAAGMEDEWTFDRVGGAPRGATAGKK